MLKIIRSINQRKMKGDTMTKKGNILKIKINHTETKTKILDTSEEA
jgi:ribosomal 50S subunit-recycling heat shock protein